MIQITAIVILYLPQQTNTWSKSAMKTIEITEDNSNENIFKKQSPSIFYKKSVLKYLTNFIGKQREDCNFIKKRLWKKCFSLNLRNFWEHLFLITPPGTASDICIQVFLIYSLNVCLQFVKTNIFSSESFQAGACFNVPQLLHRFAFLCHAF